MNLPVSAGKVLLALLLTGLAGSVSHCLGMCGPLVILAGARYPRQPARAAPLHLLYHAGRILVYGLLGALFGGLTSLVGQAAQAVMPFASVETIPGVLSVLIGLAVMAAGLSSLGWLPFWRRSVQSGGWWSRSMQRVLKTPGKPGVFLLGALNGLLPCGLVYESLLIAASTRSPLAAGLGMLLFGAATVPALTVFGVGAQLLSVRARRALTWAGGVFVVLVGLYLVVRGAAGLGLWPQLL